MLFCLPFWYEWNGVAPTNRHGIPFSLDSLISLRLRNSSEMTVFTSNAAECITHIQNETKRTTRRTAHKCIYRHFSFFSSSLCSLWLSHAQNALDVAVHSVKYIDNVRPTMMHAQKATHLILASGLFASVCACVCAAHSHAEDHRWTVWWCWAARVMRMVIHPFSDKLRWDAVHKTKKWRMIFRRSKEKRRSSEEVLLLVRIHARSRARRAFHSIIYTDNDNDGDDDESCDGYRIAYNVWVCTTLASGRFQEIQIKWNVILMIIFYSKRKWLILVCFVHTIFFVCLSFFSTSCFSLGFNTVQSQSVAFVRGSFALMK